MAVFDKRKIWREIEKARKDALKVRLGELRGLIKTARLERHAAVRAVQTDCAAQRLALRDACALRRVEASELGLRGIERAQHIFAHEHKEAKADDALGKVRKTRAKVTKKEAQGESDCAVRGNLSPDMITVFDAVKKHIKGTPRKSRTEEFLHWAEENPDEVYTLQQRVADRELAKLIAEEEQAHRALRARRSAVPF